MLMHGLVVDGALRTPDKLALRWVDRNRALTYTQAVDAMDRMAGALAHLGVVAGDRVTIFAHNGLDYLIGMLGCWRAGAIPALVNVKLADDLPYYFADHTPKVVIYTHDMADAVQRAASGTPSVQHLLCMDGPQDGALSLPDLLEQKFAAPPDVAREDMIAHLSYTSGTTGQPKGACLCHEPTIRAARCIAERLQITNADVSFGPTALSSSYQLVANLLPQLAVGASINVMGRWTRSSGWDALSACDATMFVGNPPVLTELLAECRTRGRLPSALRFVLSGGGPVPPTLRKAWRDEFNVPLVESFGQSEIGGFFALGYPRVELDDNKLLRIGPMLPDKEVRIMTTTDQFAPVGTIGEIVLRGGFMVGYWNKPDKTAQAIREGWLHSGDIGVIDADGYLTMRGRRSELINVGGRDWFPRDIEEALCRDPSVALAALIGLPDGKSGMRPVAFITLQPGQRCAVSKLKAAVARTAPYDIEPLEIVIADSLPITPTGKISKAELAKQAGTLQQAGVVSPTAGTARA
jgi:long-chain acyl-CoA synthetase